MATKKVSDVLEFKRWKHEEPRRIDFGVYLKGRTEASRLFKSLKARAGRGAVNMILSKLPKARRKTAR